MQRVNENTYIDDSLVTCVEYQLFIDEMREQGKYYQPDHWTSYQFPKGRAREPIRGVYPKFVEDFLSWVAENSIDNWLYRPPTHIEGKNFPLESQSRNLLGYWTCDPSHSSRPNWKISWIGNSSEVPFGIDRDYLLNLVREDFFLYLNEHTKWIFPSNIILEALEESIDFSMKKRVINSGIDLSFPYYDDKPRSNYGKLDIAYGRKIRLGQVLDLISHILIAPSQFRHIKDGDPEQRIKWAITSHIDIQLVLDKYLYLLFLMHRVNNNLSAFEGIRLVKERIR